MAPKPLKIGDLLLDLENPRISRAESQRDALQRIIEDQDIKLVALAESIVEDGLNPMDRFLVIKSHRQRDKFTVIEGNRRLAALRILENPAMLGGLEVRPPVQKRLETLAERFDASSVKALDCFELPDRAEGATWIAQRHTGENQGRGIVDWSGVATARFRGRDPALQALDVVLKHGDLSEDEKKEIERRFPITTLDRLLSTPAVRAKIGVEVRENKLQTALPPKEVIKPLRRMVRELASGNVTVTMLKKKEQQVDWVSKLGSDLPNLAKKSGDLRSVDTLDEKDFRAKPTSSTPSRGRQKTKPARKALIPKDCALNVANPKISEIVKELRALSLVDFPHAISVLFRVFLEQSVDHYLDANGLTTTVNTPGGIKDKNLRAKVQDTIVDMVSKGVPKKHLDGISKGIDDKNNPLCVDTLHNYVHNRFYSPRERDLTVAWDNAQLFFETIWP